MFAASFQRGFRRPLPQLALLFALLAFLTALGARDVRAQGGHTHAWEQVDTLVAPGVAVDPQEARPSQIVQVSVYGSNYDRDLCLNSECSFPDNLADNPVRVTGWSDGGDAGQFGYLDGLGQFVPTTDPELVTHYRCPPGDGTFTLFATMDDIPEAVDAGVTVATYDDHPATGYATVTVQSPLPHPHIWDEVDDIPIPLVAPERDNPTPGEAVGLRLKLYPDLDYCLHYGNSGEGPCPFGNIAENSVHVIAWTDLGAGGAVGYLDSLGQFQPTSDPALVTHYRAPNVQEPTTVTLHLAVDDDPHAVEPGSGQLVSTYNDHEVVASITLDVAPATTHQHDWEAVDDLPEGSFSPENMAPAPGDVISLNPDAQDETDHCIDPSPAPCPFPDYIAPNPVEVTGWSDEGAGGQFGYLDNLGQFVPAADPALITHYRTPPAEGTVTVRMTTDDIPWATELTTGRAVPTYNDQPTSRSVQIPVYTIPTHTHAWAQYKDIHGYVSVTPGRATAGSIVTVSAAGSDRDSCTQWSTSCPFPAHLAENQVGVTSYNDNGAGGQFGYLDGSGNFVNSSDPTRIPHTRVPRSPTGLPARSR